ncbi:MAG: DeoR/GlpR family DNA-binding transcription regulator [Phreatobacter sp.]
MRIRERREHILAILRQKHRVSVDVLADELDASRETIRRDLTDLAIRGLVRKFHGGAALPEAGLTEEASEGTFHARLSENVAQKRAIAQAAAGLFAAGDTLFVDTGSTTVLFAEELAKVSGLTVITNSVLIAQAVARGEGGSRAFLLGGEFNDEVAETLGSLVIDQIRQFHPRHVVLTIGALTPGGILDFSMGETEVARAMVEQASELTVLADSSKIDRPGLFQVCPLSSIDRLVIDQAPSGPVAAALAAAGVQLIVPEPAGSTVVDNGRRRRGSRRAA